MKIFQSRSDEKKSIKVCSKFFNQGLMKKVKQMYINLRHHPTPEIAPVHGFSN